MRNFWENGKDASRYISSNLTQLRPLELEFKKFFQATGFCPDQESLTADAFANLLAQNYPTFRYLDLGDPEEYEASLLEDKYFQKKLDVSAVEGLRYMPAVRHRHQFFEVACILSGNVRNFTENENMDLTTGDILIMPPGSEHAICSYQDDGIVINILMRSTTFEHHFLNLLPDDDLLSGFFIKALYRSSETPYLLFHTGNDVDLQDYIQQIIQECSRNNRYKNTMLNAKLSVFFVELMRRHEKDAIIPTMNHSIMNENTLFIIEYMQKNFNTITLRHLAEFFNYSERQMQRIIQSSTGLSFGENIKKIRMNHARDLLKNSDQSIQDIAEYLGYYDASSFRHAFRSETGMTPKEYRLGK
ncbi:MAG: AraC family transcriptional regulator [Bilifractor sp.]